MTTAFRPASSAEQRAADTAPKRRGRPPGSGNRSRKSLREPIEKFLLTVNMLLSVWQPKDALDAVEIGALATAIDEQAKTSPRFRRAIETLLATTGGASLLPVLAIIVGRRLSRHGVLPGGRMVDDFGGLFLQMSNAKPSEAQQAMTDIFGAMGVDLSAANTPTE